MGTISDKLTYLNETKSQLKDMINYGLPTENQITNETTFRNYVKGIFEAFIESLRDSTTLYTNLPKISGNGTQITLNDTANAPMRITLKASELTQDATPTPDTPQDIHTISGSNSVVIEGANLYNYQDTKNVSDGITTDSDGWITCTYDNSSGTSIKYMNYYTNNLNLEPSTNYNLIVEVKTITGTFSSLSVASNQNTTNSGQFTTWILNYNDLSQNTTYNSVKTTKDSWNTTTSANGLRTLVNYGTGTSGSITFRISVIKDTSITPSTFTYTPYVSQTAPINLGEYELGTIGNYSNEFVRSDGKKNLFDISKVVKGRLDSGVIGYASATTSLTTTDTTISFTTNANYRGIVLDLIEVEPNTKYIYSSKNSNATLDITCACYDNSQTYIANASRSYVDEYTYRFTTKENTKYVRIGIQLASSGTTTILQPQFELGETATDYVPYEKGWYYKQGIGKVVLDGSETIYDDWQNPNQTNTRQYYLKSSFLNNNYVPSTSSNITAMTNYFKCITHTIWNYDDERFALNDSTTYSVQFKISNTTAPTLADFKTWLSTHNTIIYYELATPTYTKITGELAQELEQVYKGMLSYDGTTNISQVNNDLPFVLGVSAIEDLE